MKISKIINRQFDVLNNFHLNKNNQNIAMPESHAQCCCDEKTLNF